MRKKLLFCGVLLFLLGLYIVRLVAGSPGEVGYSVYNSSVMAFWNSGPIENKTYITNDARQIANRPDRFSWGSYSDCIFSDAGYKKCDLDFPDYNITPISDNSTFWKAEANKSFAVSLRSNALGVKFEQKYLDAYVNRTVYWVSNVTAVSLTNFYLGWCISNISIEGDSGDDWINFEVNGKRWLLFNTSNTTPFLSYNVTSDHVTIREDAGITWKFTNNNSHGVSWDGNSLCVMEKIGTGSMSGRKQASFNWIDAECSITIVNPDPENPCGPIALKQRCVATGSLLTCQANSTGYLNLRGNFLSTCLYTGSPGCTVSTYANQTPPDTYEIPSYTSQTEKSLVCANPDTGICGRNNLANNNFGITFVQCRKSGIYDSIMNFTTSNEISDWIENNCSPDSWAPMVNATLANLTTFSTLTNNLPCNATDHTTPFKYPLRNLTFKINGTVNQTFNLFPNFTASRNATITFGQADYTYSCEACDNNGNCNNSVNKTFSTVNGFLNVSLIFPPNRSNWSNSSSINFSCRVLSNISIGNISLRSNYSNGVFKTINFSSFAGQGLKNISMNYTFSNFSAGWFVWNCLGDNGYNLNSSFANFSINVTSPPAPSPPVGGGRSFMYCFRPLECLMDNWFGLI